MLFAENYERIYYNNPPHDPLKKIILELIMAIDCVFHSNTEYYNMAIYTNNQEYVLNEINKIDIDNNVMKIYTNNNEVYVDCGKIEAFELCY